MNLIGKYREDSVVLRALLGVCDLCLVAVSMTIAHAVLSALLPASVASTDIYACLCAALCSYVVAYLYLPSNVLGRAERSDLIMGRAFITALLHTLIFVGILFLLGKAIHARALVLSHLMVFTLLLTTARLVLRLVVTHLWIAGKDARHAVLIGKEAELAPLASLLQRKKYGYIIDGYFCDTASETALSGITYLGTTPQALPRMQSATQPVDVYATLDTAHENEMASIQEFCQKTGTHFHAIPTTLSHAQSHVRPSHIGDIMCLTPQRAPLGNIANRMVKRTFDIILSALFLSTIFPVIYIVVALIIKKQSPGPVFSLQKHCGKQGKTFNLPTFRTTHVTKGKGTVEGEVPAPQTFPFGNFMRRTHIHELPLFLCVFAGKMSLVGPEAHTPQHAEKAKDLLHKYDERLQATPGITGWAQTHGSWSCTDSNEEAQRRLDADIWYVENWSLWLDILILTRALAAKTSLHKMHARHAHPDTAR